GLDARCRAPYGSATHDHARHFLRRVAPLRGLRDVLQRRDVPYRAAAAGGFAKGARSAGTETETQARAEPHRPAVPRAPRFTVRDLRRTPGALPDFRV